MGNPLQCSLPAESQDRSLVAAVYGSQRTRSVYSTAAAAVQLAQTSELKYLPSRQRWCKADILSCFFSSQVSVSPSAAEQEVSCSSPTNIATLYAAVERGPTLAENWRDFYLPSERDSLLASLPPA